MNEGELYYLTEVLGLRSVVLTGAASASTDHQKPLLETKTQKPSVFVHSPFDLEAKELELVEKMLGAIGIAHVQYLSQDQHAKKDIAKLTAEVVAGYGISFGTKPPDTAANIQWLELPAISQFLDDSDVSRRDSVKRSAWDKLKKLKSEFST